MVTGASGSASMSANDAEKLLAAVNAVIAAARESVCDDLPEE